MQESQLKAFPVFSHEAAFPTDVSPDGDGARPGPDEPENRPDLEDAT